MKRVYLLLSIIGFIAPTILVLQESMETGNILLYTQPVATVEAMFANRISSIFAIDLLFTVLVFLLWTFHQTPKHKRKELALVWPLTFLLGLAGGFPLFLFLRERD